MEAEPTKFRFINGLTIDKKHEPVERLALLEIAYQLRRIANNNRR